MENKTTQPIPYGNEETETKEEPKEINAKATPIWMKELPNGNILVETKEGTFELTDIPYEEVVRAKKRITHGDAVDMDKFELALISESLVNKKIGELDLMKLKGSTVMKLRGAVYRLYDIPSFLSL